MLSAILLALTVVLFVVGAGGAYFAFADANSVARKRLAVVQQPHAAVADARAVVDANQQRRKNVSVLLKELEKQQAQKKLRPTLRRRIEQAGLRISVRDYWILCATAALAVLATCLLTRQSLLVGFLASFAVGLGLPRWALAFLRKRRLKKFTSEFANAIDVVVRSVKTGLPTTEALKIVAKEIAEPVASEFLKLTEGLKVGVTLEQGLRRMFESIPTPEVNFFGIVMTIQQKSGGNLAEALSNLSGVLRDRKRLQDKIKSMSSEAKASAMIIGSLPCLFLGLVYLTAPSYIDLLFTERLGNIMLLGCAIWMATGIFVMKKMIDFKH
jgi:tight adherence protein B